MAQVHDPRFVTHGHGHGNDDDDDYYSEDEFDSDSDGEDSRNHGHGAFPPPPTEENYEMVDGMLHQQGTTTGYRPPVSPPTQQHSNIPQQRPPFQNHHQQRPPFQNQQRPLFQNQQQQPPLMNQQQQQSPFQNQQFKANMPHGVPYGARGVRQPQQQTRAPFAKNLPPPPVDSEEEYEFQEDEGEHHPPPPPCVRNGEHFMQKLQQMQMRSAPNTTHNTGTPSNAGAPTSAPTCASGDLVADDIYEVNEADTMPAAAARPAMPLPVGNQAVQPPFNNSPVPNNRIPPQNPSINGSNDTGIPVFQPRVSKKFQPNAGAKLNPTPNAQGIFNPQSVPPQSRSLPQPQPRPQQPQQQQQQPQPQSQLQQEDDTYELVDNDPNKVASMLNKMSVGQSSANPPRQPSPQGVNIRPSSIPGGMWMSGSVPRSPLGSAMPPNNQSTACLPSNRFIPPNNGVVGGGVGGGGPPGNRGPLSLDRTGSNNKGGDLSPVTPKPLPNFSNSAPVLPKPTPSAKPMPTSKPANIPPSSPKPRGPSTPSSIVAELKQQQQPPQPSIPQTLLPQPFSPQPQPRRSQQPPSHLPTNSIAVSPGGPKDVPCKDIAQQHWYGGKMDRKGAEAKLRATNKDGSFYIRDTDKGEGYSISLIHGGVVTHLRVHLRPGGYFQLGDSGVDKFDTVYDMVQHYRTNELKLKTGVKTKLFVE